MCFSGVPYIANIGCAASHKEALELSPEVSCITVKDKAKHWEPLPEDTYPLIYAGVRKALGDYESKTAFPPLDRYVCKLNLTEGHFSTHRTISRGRGHSTEEVRSGKPMTS